MVRLSKTKSDKIRTQSDKVLKDKTFKIGSDLKYDGYQIGLVSMIYKFFNKNLVEVVCHFSFKEICYRTRLPTCK